MALNLRISPEIWRLTLLSGLTSLTVPLVGCASKADSGANTQMNSNSSAGNGGTPLEGGNGGSSNTTTTTGTAGSTAVAGNGSGGQSTGTGQGGAGTNNPDIDAGSGMVTACDDAVGIPEAARCLGGESMASVLPGHVTCDNGLVHRAAAVDCVSELPRATLAFAPPPGDAGVAGQCDEDTDCTEQAHGYCNTVEGGLPGGFCNYGCVSDSECGAGMICDCRSPVGQCVAAECVTDADCACDATCMRVAWDDGCGPNVQYKCQTQEDECVAPTGCVGENMVCRLDGVSLNTQCANTPACAIGRPFIVQGDDRKATLISRTDWLATDVRPDLDGLDVAECTALAQYWQAVGLMEHASIAAFARFALELMGQGAPPELIEGAQQAMADETRHAKLAFALASRYANQDLGPGRLDLTGAGPSSSLAEMVHTAILEGAVGETIAAMEAAEALERASDPAVRQVLTQVVADETNHAQLAWNFLRWALQQDASLRDAMRQAFDALYQAPQHEPITSESSALPAHGLLSAALRREIRSRALVDVILPCAATLFQSVTLRQAA